MAVSALTAGGSFANAWLYVVGPLLGGGAAAAIFKLQEAGA